METLNKEISRNLNQQKSNFTELTESVHTKFRNQAKRSEELSSFIRKSQFDSKGASVASGVR